MDSIKLKKPIKVNGEEVAELTYDVNEITPAGFAEAEFRKSQASPPVPARRRSSLTTRCSCTSASRRSLPSTPSTTTTTSRE